MTQVFNCPNFKGGWTVFTDTISANNKVVLINRIFILSYFNFKSIFIVLLSANY